MAAESTHCQQRLPLLPPLPVTSAKDRLAPAEESDSTTGLPVQASAPSSAAFDRAGRLYEADFAQEHAFA